MNLGALAGFPDLHYDAFSASGSEASKMTRQELDAAIAQLGLDVPETERNGIADAVKYVEAMRASVRKPRSVMAEPAHTVAFPGD